MAVSPGQEPDAAATKASRPLYLCARCMVQDGKWDITDRYSTNNVLPKLDVGHDGTNDVTDDDHHYTPQASG